MVDFSLYLVTDSGSSLKDRDLLKVVDAALQGGVGVVQYRDKDNDTAVMVRTAKALHSLTRKYKVPLLINDRVDVAQAVGADGVHLGQDDLDLPCARKILGDRAIIGVTVSNADEAMKAVQDGANYLGIGTMFRTSTKTDTKAIIGTAGTKAILEALSTLDEPIITVAIGGINASNVQRVLYQSAADGKRLDGVAVVSAVMSAEYPKVAAVELGELISKPPPFAAPSLEATTTHAQEVDQLLQAVPAVVRQVVARKPLCHNMTNLVVQNFAANVALAVGGSPIMSNAGEEAQDLAKIGGSLVINMGSITQSGMANYLEALQAYNLEGGPVLLDPVGAGATQARRKGAKTLVDGGYFDVIKGNEGEIRTILGDEDVLQHGVDSGSSNLSSPERAKLVQALAMREKNVVLMTGAVDYLSDGKRTLKISNGHEYLGNITGSGCTVGTTIACMLAVQRRDKLLDVLSGVLVYELAAERASGRNDVKGPGTFVPALIDELHHISRLPEPELAELLVGAAKVAKVDVERSK